EQALRAAVTGRGRSLVSSKTCAGFAGATLLTDRPHCALLVPLSALESVEVIERSPPRTGQLADHQDLEFVALFFRSESRWWLAWQLQSQFRDEQFGVGGRLCAARQNQPALIDGGNPNIDHLDFCQLQPTTFGATFFIGTPPP